MPQNVTIAERIAAASVVAVIVGLLLPKAAFHSLDRALLLWITASVFLGVIVGSSSTQRIPLVVKRVLLPSALMPMTFLGFLTVRFLADVAKAGPGFTFTVPGFSGGTIAISAIEVLLAVLALSAIGFIATLLVVALACIGKRPISMGLARTMSLGPEGVEKVAKTLVAAGGVVAGLVALWVAVGA